MSRDAQVIVVGGGPAGASTAFFLASADADVLVLDRARFPRDKVCSEYMSPEASRILSAMGVLERIEAAGASHLTGMQVRSPAGTVITGSFAAGHGFRAFRDRGLAIRRILLDEILLRRAEEAGARVREGVKVVDVLRSAAGRVTGVRATDGNGNDLELRADVVVGADGLRSVVGRRLGLIRTSRWPRRIAFVGHFRGVRGVSALGEIHVERGGYFGLADVGGGITNVAVVVPVARAGAIAGADAFVDAWIAKLPHLAPRFSAAERVGSVRATGPFASSARHACLPGAALVGDAADFFDPITGEGVYSALRGGEMLASHLSANLGGGASSLDAAVQAYDRERRAEFAGKWKFERLVGLIVASPIMMNHMARNLSGRPDLTDLLIGVAGDFIPPAAVLNPRYLFNLFVTPALRA